MSSRTTRPYWPASSSRESATTQARLGYARRVGRVGLGSWFAWAVVGADAVVPLAAAAGLEVLRLHHDARERRWFASLVAGPASSWST